jgi:hypothetical protein
VTNADYKELTDRLIASVDDLISAHIPEEEKRELIDKSIRRLVWPYKSAAAARCELDTDREEVYSKKSQTKGFGYL